MKYSILMVEYIPKHPRYSDLTFSSEKESTRRLTKKVLEEIMVMRQDLEALYAERVQEESALEEAARAREREAEARRRQDEDARMMERLKNEEDLAARAKIENERRAQEQQEQMVAALEQASQERDGVLLPSPSGITYDSCLVPMTPAPDSSSSSSSWDFSLLDDAVRQDTPSTPPIKHILNSSSGASDLLLDPNFFKSALDGPIIPELPNLGKLTEGDKSRPKSVEPPSTPSPGPSLAYPPIQGMQHIPDYKRTMAAPVPPAPAVPVPSAPVAPPPHVVYPFPTHVVPGQFPITPNLPPYSAPPPYNALPPSYLHQNFPSPAIPPMQPPPAMKAAPTMPTPPVQSPQIAPRPPVQYVPPQRANMQAGPAKPLTQVPPGSSSAPEIPGLGATRQTNPSTATSGLRRVILYEEMFHAFLAKAHYNTQRRIETCGVLSGKLEGNVFRVTNLIIPCQEGTTDTCNTTDEAKLFEYQFEHDLLTLGWIHTHPTQDCFLSSVDLHTHASYQYLLPEAVAVVMAPSRTANFGVFRLSDPPGLQLVQKCKLRGFHPHTTPEGRSLYTVCSHVDIIKGSKFVVEDQR
eukprot:TRINITY_DN1640_c0_g1_i5.p1 TRINITY_DN1640_c0_g1~~TRINITY_DN1640_c0_g1_i5.p1  ORF type:complete len:646 (+),score=105.67 TRINITY_DN1640_c0_g1_i5:204-1940(+)